jgi:hypothetical protein
MVSVVAKSSCSYDILLTRTSLSPISGTLACSLNLRESKPSCPWTVHALVVEGAMLDMGRGLFSQCANYD